jgi:putative drug exporter of the RND superfamily
MVLLLAPALLVLFGRRTWALPRWLARVVPHIDIEGQGLPQEQDKVPVRVPAGASPTVTPAGHRPAEHPPSQTSLDQLLDGHRPAGPHSEGGR